MPSDERYRAQAMAPRPHRILRRRPEGPGQVALTLAAADGAATDPITPADPASPGQYWVLHTAAGAKVPAVDVTLPADDPDVVATVTTLGVPRGTGRRGRPSVTCGSLWSVSLPLLSASLCC
ncbi:hypothetical protein [Actinoallomurus sp. NPDC050550]|uniref:hypothetical protein n=1 Tax=Actinoallomurus sp. NPDC050550 TaxID=3154937 RepID=UPI0033E46858